MYQRQQQCPFVYIFIPYWLPECLIRSKSFALCERQTKIPSPECSTLYEFPFCLHIFLLSSLTYMRLKKFFISTPISFFFFYRRAFYLRARQKWCCLPFNETRLQRREIRRSLGALWSRSQSRAALRAALRAGSERLNPTSSGCIRHSHHIVMHKRSF